MSYIKINEYHTDVWGNSWHLCIFSTISKLILEMGLSLERPWIVSLSFSIILKFFISFIPTFHIDDIRNLQAQVDFIDNLMQNHEVSDDFLYFCFLALIKYYAALNLLDHYY